MLLRVPKSFVIIDFNSNVVLKILSLFEIYMCPTCIGMLI